MFNNEISLAVSYLKDFIIFFLLFFSPYCLTTLTFGAISRAVSTGGTRNDDKKRSQQIWRIIEIGLYISLLFALVETISGGLVVRLLKLLGLGISGSCFCCKLFFRDIPADTAKAVNDFLGNGIILADKPQIRSRMGKLKKNEKNETNDINGEKNDGEKK